MAYPTFPNIPVSPSTKVSRSHRTLKAKFGDGYEQVALDGINTLEERVRLEFSDRPMSEILAIRDFLDEVTTVTPFQFQLPYDTQIKLWRLQDDGYETGFRNHGAGDISFTIKRTYA